MSGCFRSSASFRFVLNITQEAGIAIYNGGHIKTRPMAAFKTCDTIHSDEDIIRLKNLTYV